jgi:hypothetical protein
LQTWLTLTVARSEDRVPTFRALERNFRVPRALAFPELDATFEIGHLDVTNSLEQRATCHSLLTFLSYNFEWSFCVLEKRNTLLTSSS